MDQITLVDRRVIDGQKLILQLSHDGFDFMAAFWLRPVDDNWWHLYLASKLVDEQGPAVAYRKVQASLQKLPGTSISLSDIKIIGETDRLTHDIVKIRKRYTGATPIWFGGAQLGGMLIEEALIYPPVPKEKRSSFFMGKRRLKTSVQQTVNARDLFAPFSQQEIHALGQIVALGISPAQADYWVLKKREMQGKSQIIPAGAIVDAYVIAWWGDDLKDDPNPLLHVKTAEGAEGLTFLDNTEPLE
jgi:hypothetical protein